MTNSEWERRPGTSKLVYDKEKRTIITVQTPTHESGPGGETYVPPTLGVPASVIDAMAHELWEVVGLIDMERARRCVESGLLAAAREGYVMAYMPRKAKRSAP